MKILHVKWPTGTFKGELVEQLKDCKDYVVRVIEAEASTNIVAGDEVRVTPSTVIGVEG